MINPSTPEDIEMVTTPPPVALRRSKACIFTEAVLARNRALPQPSSPTESISSKYSDEDAGITPTPQLQYPSVAAFPMGYSPFLPSPVRPSRSARVLPPTNTQPLPPPARRATVLVDVAARSGDIGQSPKVCWYTTHQPLAKLSTNVAVTLVDANHGPHGSPLPIIGITGIDANWVTFLLDAPADGNTTTQTLSAPFEHVALSWAARTVRFLTTPWRVNEFADLPLPLPQAARVTIDTRVEATHLEDMTTPRPPTC